ncbi:hypothetical protein Gotri_022679 [Gossypium trilobum]|uniref:DDE-1 domain-containing protein n=1 Tax=Gossypium trilobum TaxID=34281 RepID=A0A7J9DH18_9ROSI|nr:hypothetical protein [Gossypium trilobum]
MVSHLKGVKKATLTDEMRKALCEYKNEHSSSNKKDLQQWVQQTFDFSVIQSTISNTLKRAVKIYYRRRFYSSTLEGYKKGEINLEKINVLDTIHFINDAWNIDVKPTTIANCFRHCKIQSEEDMPFEQEIDFKLSK